MSCYLSRIVGLYDTAISVLSPHIPIPSPRVSPEILPDRRRTASKALPLHEVA